MDQVWQNIVECRAQMDKNMFGIFQKKEHGEGVPTVGISYFLEQV